MMHHCAKFGENGSSNVCVIASQTPNMHIFLINKEGGKKFDNMAEALAPPPQQKKPEKNICSFFVVFFYRGIVLLLFSWPIFPVGHSQIW